MNIKLNKSMEDIFDIEPIPKEENRQVPAILEPIPIVQKDTLNDDLMVAYAQTKDNLQEIIDQGLGALENILTIANESQQPRGFEVYAGLLKNLVDANREILDVQKKMREMTGMKSGHQESSTNIQNAVFLGTTADLGKLIKQQTKQNE